MSGLRLQGKYIGILKYQHQHFQSRFAFSSRLNMFLSETIEFMFRRGRKWQLFQFVRITFSLNPFATKKNIKECHLTTPVRSADSGSGVRIRGACPAGPRRHVIWRRYTVVARCSHRRFFQTPRSRKRRTGTSSLSRCRGEGVLIQLSEKGRDPSRSPRPGVGWPTFLVVCWAAGGGGWCVAQPTAPRQPGQDTD